MVVMGADYCPTSTFCVFCCTRKGCTDSACISLCWCRLTFQRDRWKNLTHGTQNRWKDSSFSTRVLLVYDVHLLFVRNCQEGNDKHRILAEISTFFKHNPTR